MRIVHIITRSDSVGGAQVHVRDLSIIAREQGHEVTVLTGGEGPFTEDLSDHGVPWLSIPSLRRPIRPIHDWLAFHQIRAALGKLDPAVTSTHSSKAGMLGRMAAWSLGRPVLFTAHGWAFHPSIPKQRAIAYRYFEALGARFATRIITVSDFDRQLALDCRVAPESKLVTVHNGIPDVTSSLRASPERTPARLLMVARFEEQKDHHTLFHALAGLKDDPWEVDLIGDGPLLSRARAEADALGIAGRLRFLGSRRDVAEQLAAAQGFLLISKWEGFPISILEAMRAGLPVIASAVGGVPESVTDDVTGLLVPYRDVEGLRLRLAGLIRDAGLRARLGASGRSRYERQFTLEHTFRKTLLVYQDVIGTSRELRSERVSPARVGNRSGPAE